MLTFAYIDPASGSIVLQAIIAGTVGVAAVFRNRFFALFGWMFRIGSPDKSAE